MPDEIATTETMSNEPVAVQAVADVTALQAEVERLRAENERLTAKSAAKSHDRARNIGAVAIVLIAALLIAITPAAIWMRNVVFDTDTWVETVGPLADDPDIQNAVAKAASDALIARLDAETRIAEILPDNLGLDRFAPLLASSVESTIRTQATNVVRSKQFAQIWRDINRTSHKALIAAITGRQGEVASLQAGTLTLDTGALVEKVKERLVARGLGFVANVPTGMLDRDIVLFQSDALAAAGVWVQGIQTAAYSIPIIGVVLLGAGFLVAASKQRAALAFGIALTAFGILPTQMLYLAQYSAVRNAERLAGIPSAAAQSAFDIIFRDLVAVDRVVVFLGIVILLAALVAGPSRWAKTVRGAFSGGLATLSADIDLGLFGAWVGAHRGGLRTVGFIAAAAALVTLESARSIGGIIWITVLTLLWLVAIEFVGAVAADDVVVAEGVAVAEGAAVVVAPGGTAAAVAVSDAAEVTTDGDAAVEGDAADAVESDDVARAAPEEPGDTAV